MGAFGVSHLAPNIACPMLVLHGEAEPAESNEKVALSNLRFIQQLTCPVSVRMFDYSDGWAASHCHIGGLAALHRVLFDWLDTAVHHPERLPRHDLEEKVFDVFAKYMRSHQATKELDQLRRPCGKSVA